MTNYKNSICDILTDKFKIIKKLDSFEQRFINLNHKIKKSNKKIKEIINDRKI